MVPGGAMQYAAFIASSDEKTMIALGYDQTTKRRYLWRYRAGKWTASELPEQLWTEFAMTQVLPLGTSQLLFYCNPRNEGPELGPAATSLVDEKRNVAALIRQLGDSAFATRRAASDELLACGPLILPKLVLASTATTDGEVKARLDSIIAQYKHLPAIMRLGPYMLKGIRGAVGDAKGRAYISAVEVTEKDRNLGDGLIVGDGTSWDFLPNDTALDGILTPIPHGEVVFDALVCGDNVWIQDGRTDRTNGLRRINFLKRSLEPPIPRNDLAWIFGRQKDGTVFAGISHQGELGNTEVVAYRPGTPLDSRPIAATSSELWGLVCAPDGKLWAMDLAGPHLVCFDGKVWKSRTKISGTIDSFSVGTDDTVMAFGRGELGVESKVLLVTPKEVVESENIQTLVQGHLKEITAAFGMRQASKFSDCGVVADHDDHVWVSKKGDLQVFSAGHWMTVHWADSHGRLVRLMPDDGHASVILQAQGGGTCEGFTASIENDKPVLTPWRQALSFYPDTPSTLSAFRHGDMPQDYDARPVLVDSIGHIWSQGLQAGEVTLFRKGKKIGKLRVPGLQQDWRGAADDSGNVFLISSLGVEYWAYDKSLPGVPFKCRGIFTVPSMPKQVLAICYSNLGYLAIWGMTEKPPGFTGGMYRHEVVLVKVGDMN